MTARSRAADFIFVRTDRPTDSLAMPYVRRTRSAGYLVYKFAGYGAAHCEPRRVLVTRLHREFGDLTAAIERLSKNDKMQRALRKAYAVLCVKTVRPLYLFAVVVGCGEDYYIDMSMDRTGVGVFKERRCHALPQSYFCGVWELDEPYTEVVSA